jgi:hypothetical protein
MSTQINSGAVANSVSFKAWTGDRSIESVGTAAGSGPLPFQRWRTFKEAFAPEIVERAVHETPGQVRHVVDPFGGSGTTALAAQFLGVKPTTIEVNPYLADLIQAKLTSYDFDELTTAFRNVCKAVNELKVPSGELFPGAPATFVEPGVHEQFLFSRPVAARIALYKDAIRRLKSDPMQRLFIVLLGSVLVAVSNVVISGKGRRYRGSWRSRLVLEGEVDELFKQRVLDAIYDLRVYRARACREYVVLRGDCRELVTSTEMADLAVFSPPYPNSFDYTDVYNVELWVLGYLNSAKDNMDLRNATLRSHVQVQRDMNGRRYSSKALSRTLNKLEKVRSLLWNRHIPDMIYAYISDMGNVMSALSARLRSEGRVYMVVGDSRYGNIDVPVAKILSQIAGQTDLKLLKAEPCRSMRASPQQGGREELPETLLVFSK